MLRNVERRIARLRAPLAVKLPDLVLTDIVMPKLGGPEFVRRLTARRPDLKVLYMSGYAADALGPGRELEPGANLLQKPFTPDRLAWCVRRVIDGLSLSTRIH